jgi:predicted Zn-ribbon and HTH transcriptional regulator
MKEKTMKENLTTIELKVCKRCGYKWFPRQLMTSVRCPKCHSPYWNIDRIRTRKPIENGGEKKDG